MLVAPPSVMLCRMDGDERALLLLGGLVVGVCLLLLGVLAMFGYG